MSDRVRRKDVVASDALDDPTIPVLTERLTLPDLDLDFTLPPAPQPSPAAAAPAARRVPVEPPDAFGPAPETTAPAPPEPPPLPPTATTRPPSAPTVPSTADDAVSPRDMAPARPTAPRAPATPPTPGPEAGLAAPPAAVPVPTGTGAPTPSPTSAATALQWDLGRMDRAQVELREAILTELAQRLPQDVETIVRTQMAAAIDAAVNRLAQEARLALASSLREIVDRAVRAELHRLRSSDSHDSSHHAP